MRVGVGALALAACVDPAGSVDVGTTDQLAIVCGDGATVRGMDVSYYEPTIDWNAVHAGGIEFAFIRVSDGLQFIDPRFAGYWANARAAGVIRGAYQYFRPAQDPIAQADLLLSRMGPLQPGDLPPVLDVEDRNSGLQPPQIAAAVRTWVSYVTAQLGRPPIIYAGLYSWLELTGSADVTSSPLWVAQYTSNPCPNIPVPWTRWMFWQHTATGSAPGIPGSTLDLNVFNGSIEDLRAFTVPGACGDGVCSGAETAGSCDADCPPCATLGPQGGVIDDGDACFDMGGPAAFLRRVDDAGDRGDLVWTHATSSAREANYAQWNLHFETAGTYRIEAYTAADYAESTRAAYVIKAAGSERSVTLDQTAVDGWQSLGEVAFDDAGAQSIHLGDNTGEPNGDQVRLVFDAIRLTRVDPPIAPMPSDPDDDPQQIDDDGDADPGGVAESGCSAASPSPGNSALLALTLLGLLTARGRRDRRRATSPRRR